MLKSCIIYIINLSLHVRAIIISIDSSPKKQLELANLNFFVNVNDFDKIRNEIIFGVFCEIYIRRAAFYALQSVSNNKIS